MEFCRVCRELSMPTSSRAISLFAVLGLLAGSMWGQVACDLDGSGSVNVVDVNRSVAMVLGTVPCTANVEGPQVCTIITVQRVVNAALGQACVTYTAGAAHSVAVSWLPVNGVAGYQVYRRSSPTDSYVKISTALIPSTNFSDSSVQLGQTYSYVVTAVDSAGVESLYSVETVAVIPST